MNVAEFLTARLDEDQADALATGDPRAWYVETRNARDYPQEVASLGNVALICNTFRGRGVNGDEDPYVTARHIARWSTKRVLAEVAAKRAILARWESPLPQELYDAHDWNEVEDGGKRDAVVDLIVRHLAAVYAEHPDFDPAWRLP